MGHVNIWKVIVLVQIGLKVVKVGRAFVKAHRINRQKVNQNVMEFYSDL